MAIITFANTKGGAGKTTAVSLLASELARRGFRTTIVDADPQRWASRWCEASPKASHLNAVSYVTAKSLRRQVATEANRSGYVLVDLPGSCSPLTATALSLSDYVLIPIQGCAMDAQGGAQVLELLEYLKAKAGISIPYSVVLSRVNPLTTTRALQAVKRMLAQRNVHVLDTPIMERSAFRDVFDHSLPLHMMTDQRVSRLDKALNNAAGFADEVVRLLDSGLGRMSPESVLRSSHGSAEMAAGA